MSKYILKNDRIEIVVSSFGAELISILDNENIQYLWSGNPEFWGRRSPILFPIVGNLKSKQYSYKGNDYQMSQHGFARDKEFDLDNHTENEIWFNLRADEETKIIYPFDFCLKIGYKLSDNKIEVMWKVTNEDDVELPFSIGGHPAFMCPLNGKGVQTDYRIITNAKENMKSTLITINGLADNTYKEIELNNGSFPITKDMFDDDALVLEHNQVKSLAIAYKDETPYVTINFDMPACGIWSPAKKNAPFICLEPWCGRCDGEDFVGDIYNREYINILKSGEEFSTKYEIIIR